MISKYTKGSRIHQVLECIQRCPISLKDIRADIKYTESITRLEEYTITPLMKDKFITYADGLYTITQAGGARMLDLGSTKKMLPKRSTINRMAGEYDGKELAKSVERTGADEHFKYPSRRGDHLFYRDGRVEAV